MADEIGNALQATDCWPTFPNDQSVVGWKLLDFVKWISLSKGELERQAEPSAMPIIAMPPMQRSAVWRPKQVLDLWNSLMRGMPIGTFYLVWKPASTPLERVGPRDVVVTGTNKTVGECYLEIGRPTEI